jgi:hypothetical protein
MPRAKELVPCSAADVATWITLSDTGLLGPEPIPLPASTVARLKEYGAIVELTSREAASILRVSEWRVRTFSDAPDEVAAGRAVLGYRQPSPKGRRLIVAGELAAWIALTRKPPVPTTGAIPLNAAAARRAADAVRAKHNLAR